MELLPGRESLGLGMEGQTGKSWPGTDAEFNISYICGCLLFFERRLGTSPFYLYNVYSLVGRKDWFGIDKVNLKYKSIGKKRRMQHSINNELNLCEL